MIIHFLFLISTSSFLIADSFSSIREQILGEIYILKKNFESPDTLRAIYDSQHFQYLYDINRQELIYREETYKQKKSEKKTNDTIFIPVEEEGEFYFAKALSFWQTGKKTESIFYLKSLYFLAKNPEIVKKANSHLKTILSRDEYRTLYFHLDPVFSYTREKDMTTVLFPENGIQISLPFYWFLKDFHTAHYFFTTGNDHLKIFSLFNEKYYILIHRIKLEEEAEKDSILLLFDNYYSWNQHTKGHYNFRREMLSRNIFLTTYYDHELKSENFFYETVQILKKNAFYLRIYEKEKNITDTLTFLEKIKIR